MITSAGVGSGIDIESLVTNLMNAERVPLTNLQQKQSEISIKISAFGTIRSQMSTMKDNAIALGDNQKFGNFTATSSDEEIFTATTTSGTNAENHEINVLTLAQAHRMTSAAYIDANAAVGTGTYNFSSGSNSFSVNIDGSNDSLIGLRDAINDSTDNTSINASILNVDGGSRLILTAKEGGTANAITAPGMFTELTAASDATLEIDGFMTTSSSNTVADAIPGVTLELKGIGTADVTSERSLEDMKTFLNEFIQSYNTLRNTLVSNSEGTLKGDNTHRTFEQTIRQEFFTDIDLGNGETISPYDLGFTFDKAGVLSLDNEKFEEATSGNMETFVAAFTTTTTGFAQKIEDIINNYTRADGYLDNKKNSLDSRDESLDDQILRLERRLEQTEARYRRQFTAMDQTVAQLRSGSEYLLSQLGLNS